MALLSSSVPTTHTTFHMPTSSTTGVTSSNIYSTGSTNTSAITPSPTTGTPRLAVTINSSSVSTGMPASTLTTITPTSRGTNGSFITIPDLTSTSTVSKMSTIPTCIIPSPPAAQYTDTTCSVITTSSTGLTMAPMLTSTHSTPPPTLATHTPVTYAGSSSTSTSSNGTIRTEISSLTTNATPLSTLITTFPSTHAAFTPTVTMATTEITTPTNTSISATSSTATSPTLSAPETAMTVTRIVNSMLTTTPNSLPTFSPLSGMENTGTSVTAFTTLFSSETTRTSPTIIMDAPSSISTGTVPSYTVLISTQRPTSGSWMSTNSVTVPYMPGFMSLPLTMKPSSRFPTAMVTSIKLTHSTPPTIKIPETPVVISQATTTLMSPRATSTTTQMTTQSRLITPQVGPTASLFRTCDHGGTWMLGLCHCPLGFSGDHCELQEIRCQNGGKWDGLKCHFPSIFHGYCWNTVGAEGDMEGSVDQEISPDLNDNTSKAYEDFSDTFWDQKIYQNVQGFKDVEILSLRNGSIVVPFSLQLESEYEKVKTVLKEELQNVSHNGGSCRTLCFRPDSIKVTNDTRKELTLEAICRRATAKGYEDFFFPSVEENRLCCVTKCTSGVDGAIDCHQGQCLVERISPARRCFSTDTRWFSGHAASTAGRGGGRERVGGGREGGKGVPAGAVLLCQRVAPTQVLGRRRMCDEDTVGTFSDLGLEDERTVKDENFQVALEDVDINVSAPLPTPSFTHILWRVHIQRPEVASSLLWALRLPLPPCPLAQR
ncbi:intestinal mucin [Lynx pardinus]|uniref:Intestinal mucin n=1 Tax=Lynx pardinus TaxID=191816 RepID=A0A485MCZ9_LYNPA|nr:intestinal mucin [Lynx pardinus]